MPDRKGTTAIRWLLRVLGATAVDITDYMHGLARELLLQAWRVPKEARGRHRRRALGHQVGRGATALDARVSAAITWDTSQTIYTDGTSAPHQHKAHLYCVP